MIKENKTYESVIEHTISDYAFCKIKYNKTIKTIKISTKHLLKAMDGDTVYIKLQKGKPLFGYVTKILNRKEHIIIGEVIEIYDKYAFIQSWTNNYYRDFYLPLYNDNNIKKGDIIEYGFKSWNKTDKNPKAFLIKKLDISLDKKKDFKLLYKFGLPTSFSEKALEEAKKISRDVVLTDNRIDLRYLDTFSIDPENSVDIDDALSVEKISNGYRIGVHISDVSYYVRTGTELDKTAYERVFTTYLPYHGINVHILPEQLSTDLCSLLADTDRYCISLLFDINESWEVIDKTITRSIIRNRNNFTYETAEQNRNNFDSKYHHRLNLLYSIGETLRKKEFPNEMRISDSEKEIQIIESDIDSINNLKIKHKTRTLTMDLVHSWMLLCNKTVTETIENYIKNTDVVVLPWIYRIHNDILHDQLINLKKDFANVGIIWNESISIEQNILIGLDPNNKYRTCDRSIVSRFITTKLGPGLYFHKKHNHFTLGSDQYSHFTSPIRRYTDIINHRILINVLEKKPIHKDSFKKECIRFNTIEKKIKRIETSIESDRIYRFMKTIDYSINAKIIGFSKKGIYIRTEFGIDGIVLAKNLNSNEYIWNGGLRKWDRIDTICLNISDTLTVKSDRGDGSVSENNELCFIII